MKKVRKTKADSETTKAKESFPQPQNYYTKISDDIKNRYTQNPNPLALQHPSYTCIIGPSGCGKTSLLMNLIFDPDFRFMWDQIILITAIPDEPLYRQMQDRLAEKQEKAEEKLGIAYPLLIVGNDIDQLPSNEELFESSEDRQKLVIFDDMLTKGKKTLDKIANLFVMARKFNCSLIFIGQHNTKIPRTIRTNCHYVILFYQDTLKEQKIIADDYASNLTQPQFIDLFVSITKPNGGPVKNSLLIDLNQQDPFLKFRKNILEPIDIREYGYIPLK